MLRIATGSLLIAFLKSSWLDDRRIHHMTSLVLCAADTVPESQPVEIVADGRVFAVFKVDGTIHVLDGICAHAGGPLGKGSLRKNIVTCPWHGWQFNIETGRHCLTERICQTTYPARIEAGSVIIDVD